MNDWHRLEQVIKWTGLSVNSFALNIGLKRSENLYQIKKGNNGISRDLAELIATKYPSVSKGWLLSGEGTMFIEQRGNGSSQGVPYYAMDAVQAVAQESLGEPQYRIDIPPFYGCDLAALTLGGAMQPDIPAGATVLLKKWTVGGIVPGEPYLVWTPEFRGIRIIRTTDDDGRVILVPRNTGEFDPMVVEKDKILGLYLVCGIIVKRNV